MILLVPLTFLASSAAASAWPLPWSPTHVAVVPFGCGLALLVAARRHATMVAALACLATSLALLRLDLQRLVQPPSAVSVLTLQEGVTGLRGAVVEPPVPRDRAQQVRLRVDAVQLANGWTAAGGNALVTAPPTPPLSYGDVLEVRGKVKAPEDGAAAGYAALLRRQGIDAIVAFPTIRHLGRESPDPRLLALAGLRARVAGAVEAYLPEPEAALVEGILVGQRTSIPKDLTDDLNRSGTSHIVAISGYNVGIAIGVATFALGGGRLRRAPEQLFVAVAASGALWGFVALVGTSGSVLRAAAMAQLALVGRALGRQGSAGGLLLWGSVFLAGWRPSIVLDVGWQLSFLGTAGLIWLSPAVERAVARLLPKVPAAARQMLAATVAAQACVLPVLAAVFGRVSLVAPLANVLVLPLVPLIMLGGALLVGAALVVPFAAPLCAALTWVPAAALILAVHWSGGLPAAAAPVPAWPPAAVAAYLVALAGVCTFLEQRNGTSPPAPLPPARSFRARLGTFALVCLAGLACVGWAMASPVGAASRPALVVDAPAIPEGTLVLAQSGAGPRVLVNGGPTASGAVALLGEYLRPWDRTVDVAVLADPREQYALGLVRVLERYRVGVFIDASDDYPSATYRQVRTTAQRRGVPRVLAEPGTEIDVGSSFTLEILGAPSQADPPPRGATPLSVRLRSDNVSLLVAADGTPAQARALLAAPQPLASTVLLIPERAARQPGAEALLRAVSPELAVVQGNPPVPRVTATSSASGASSSSRQPAGPESAAESTSPASSPRSAPAGSTSARSVATPPSPTPVVLHVAEGEPEPTWHHTSTDGPLRLEVRDEGYYIVPGR